MYKRQFYAIDHANNADDPSSSDSDDDSGLEEEEAGISSPSHDEEAPGSDGSDVDSDDDDGDGEPPESGSEEDEEWSAYRDRNLKVVQSIDSSHFLSKKPVEAATEAAAEAVDHTDRDEVEQPVGDGVVLRIGGVLKCRLCVKIICLSDETMRAHLQSKVCE